MRTLMSSMPCGSMRQLTLTAQQQQHTSRPLTCRHRACGCCCRHNTHHAFPYSARHGLEWWEIDITWYLICALQAAGIVWDVQVPSQKVRDAKLNKQAAKQQSAKAA